MEKIVVHDNEAERQKYTDFIIASIMEIFRPPTKEQSKESSDIPVEKLADTLLTGATKVIEAVRK